jgi:hypothetical protein
LPTNQPRMNTDLREKLAPRISANSTERRAPALRVDNYFAPSRSSALHPHPSMTKK